MLMITVRERRARQGWLKRECSDVRETIVSFASRRSLTNALIGIKNYAEGYQARNSTPEGSMTLEFILIGVSVLGDDTSEEALANLGVRYVESLSRNFE